MNTGKYVFSQLLDFVNKYEFDKCVNRYFGNYLIKLVRPMYADYPIPNINIGNEKFALDSTSISCSINLLVWAEGKYSRGAVKCTL